MKIKDLKNRSSMDTRLYYNMVHVLHFDFDKRYDSVPISEIEEMDLKDFVELYKDDMMLKLLGKYRGYKTSFKKAKFGDKSITRLLLLANNDYISEDMATA